MKSLTVGTYAVARPSTTGRMLVRKALLACGILAPLLYVVANEVIAVSLYPGYDRISHPVSALTATFAPSSRFLAPMISIYLVLLIGFGVGVWLSARGKRTLKVISWILILGNALGVVASAFPMTHLDLRDTMHNILSGLVPPLSFLLTTGFGIASLGKRFRLFSVVTLAVLVMVVVFIGVQTAQVAAGSTPSFFGISERVLTWVWFLWVTVLSITLLREKPDR